MTLPSMMVSGSHLSASLHYLACMSIKTAFWSTIFFEQQSLLVIMSTHYFASMINKTVFEFRFFCERRAQAVMRTIQYLNTFLDTLSDLLEINLDSFTWRKYLDTIFCKTLHSCKDLSVKLIVSVKQICHWAIKKNLYEISLFDKLIKVSMNI